MARIFHGRYILRELFKEGTVWYARIRDRRTNTTRRLSTRQQQRRKAEQVAIEIIEEIHRQEEFGVSPIAFEPAIREFLSLKNVSARVRKEHGYTAGVLLRDFQHFAVHEVSAKEVEEFLQKIAAKGRAPRTQKTYLHMLRGFYRWAIRRGYARVDPTDGLRTPREHKRAGYALTFDEARRLLTACREPIVRVVNYTNRKPAEQTWTPPTHLYLAVLISLYTGLRRGNVVGLLWRDVDFRKRQIRIDAARMKAGEDAIVPIHCKLAQTLRRTLRRRGKVEPDAPVLGDALSEIKKSFKSALRRAELPTKIRWHDLRHTYASWMETRCSYAQLKQLLAHSLGDVTLRYVHVKFEALRDAVDRLPDLLAPAVPAEGEDAASSLR